MNLRAIYATVLVSVLLGACARSAEPTGPEVIVHQSATCNCCKLWPEQLRDASFAVTPRNTNELDAVKQRLRVPTQMHSCHTAEVGGYFIEGHVPIRDVERLLKERPDAIGLAVPGMPIGSPGMESPSGKVQPYSVFLIGKDGSAKVFSKHGPLADQAH